MDKAAPNHFYVNRQLLQSDRWISEPFTRGQAWIDLCGLAQHKDSHVRIRGVRVEVKRGQLAYSQVTLAKRWRWSRGKVKRFLNELKMVQDIEQQNSEVTTLITIKKYDYWQGRSTADGAANGQQTGSKRYTYNNENNDKNEKKYPREKKFNFKHEWQNLLANTVRKHEWADEGYIEKTIDQGSRLTKDHKDKFLAKADKVINFAKNNPDFARKVWNELAGLVNDYQMQERSGYNNQQANQVQENFTDESFGESFL